MCYRAGAYRSAIVNSWIAVVFDLIDKIRELALTGDTIAVTISNQYETYLAQIEAGNSQGIKNALEFERSIVTTCRDKLQFFNHQELRDLNRLREDRHQCAHPSFQKVGEPYRPSAEQARLHLRNAVEHVLSQPPVQGRTAITALTTQISSEYFPKERSLALITLRGTALLNANEALIRGVIDALIFGYATPAHIIYNKNLQVGAALGAILDLHRSTAEERITNQLNKVLRNVNDTDFPLWARLAATMEEATLLVDEAARIRLAAFLRTGPFTEIEKVLGGLTRHPELALAAASRIAELDSTELAMVISRGARIGAVKERALILLSEALNYDHVNSRFLRLIMPLLDSFNRTDIQKIIRMPTETTADLIGANGYSIFISKVRTEGLIPVVELNTLLLENRASYLISDN